MPGLRKEGIVKIGQGHGLGSMNFDGRPRYFSGTIRIRVLQMQLDSDCLRDRLGSSLYLQTSNADIEHTCRDP